MMTADDVFKDGRWMKTTRVGADHVFTRACSAWHGMRRRCRADESQKLDRATYIGCQISENFDNFNFFAEWCQKQVGYGVKGFHLDKDVLAGGAKIYHEDVCVFIPQSLNNFFTLRENKPTGLPCGVSFNAEMGRFKSQIGGHAKRGFLGYFATPEGASDAYISAWLDACKEWVRRLEAREFVVDPRVIEAIRKKYK